MSLTNQQMPHVIYNQQAIPMSVIRRQEPTVYAQIDMKRIPQCLQPLSPPHPSSFQTLHHPHLPAYIPRPLREEQLIHENAISAETPLMSPRDTSVSNDRASTARAHSSGGSQALQPLLEVSSTRTPTMTSTQPRTVTATRF